MAGTSWIGLRLDALDTLFFRDGRPFDAASRATGGLPAPQTLAGAVRTALLARTGFDFARFAAERKNGDVMAALRKCRANEAVISASFRGPWLALADDREVTPLLPMPEVLKRAKSAGWSRAKPRKPQDVPGWHDPNDLHPVWRDQETDAKAAPELLTLAGLTSFLTGDDPADAECVKLGDVHGYDHRVGIEVSADSFTTKEGMLYGIQLLALKRRYPDHPTGRKVCLYAEIQVDGDLEHHLANMAVPFGGEGKYVGATKVPACVWPAADASAKHSLWYLATPTFFSPTGRPLPRVAGLTAAASGAGIPVSGWDVAYNGPRPTRFAVPAGAVYFVEGPGESTAFLDGEQSGALRQEGWGFALQGKWEG
ncbi:type III-B CRISPR module-associated Cmr3 family protein [Fimbriiglobus ruber]|uniref:CRISPR-associated RAMP Cmr3 n=1 Tax=Fimbriiglobus ruber TaxID=1908690 RepID=A0A225DU74_9BACT|nr:type III-B CRISPR module-associated Cmr3 family protein [Fimbriiglobus ruber]OWK41126.1 CRISPR-associated RAMP Cmr3 [Fimbriiglobus ruber]